VGKVVKLNPKRKKTVAAKPAGRKIGRDLFAVLIVGLSIGIGLAWMEIDASGAQKFIAGASAKVRELAAKLPVSEQAVDEEMEVSSIGKKPAAETVRKERTSGGYYPICGMSVATRKNCVIDGDTFYYGGTTIRVSDIDAPETHPPRCAYEADLGDRATVRLSQLLSAGPFQLVRQNRDTDKYGRQLRIVIRDGRSLGKIMVGEGLVRPWTGKRRPWCDGENAAG
jgi:endonuclease YncB( thermonuclease family)